MDKVQIAMAVLFIASSATGQDVALVSGIPGDGVPDWCRVELGVVP